MDRYGAGYGGSRCHLVDLGCGTGGAGCQRLCKYHHQDGSGGGRSRPGVVRSLYDNKEQLLSAALRVPFDPSGSIPKLIAPGLDGMGERLVRVTLQLSGDEQVRKDANNLMQSARASAGVEQLRGLTDFLQATLLDRVVEAMGVPDARMRGALITAYLAGVAATRSMLNIEPLASATDEVIVALVAPTIQRLLDPTQPLPTKDAPGKS